MNVTVADHREIVRCLNVMCLIRVQAVTSEGW